VPPPPPPPAVAPDANCAQQSDALDSEQNALNADNERLAKLLAQNKHRGNQIKQARAKLVQACLVKKP
jgi:hypothetical protein